MSCPNPLHPHGTTISRLLKKNGCTQCRIEALEAELSKRVIGEPPGQDHMLMCGICGTRALKTETLVHNQSCPLA